MRFCLKESRYVLLGLHRHADNNVNNQPLCLMQLISLVSLFLQLRQQFLEELLLNCQECSFSLALSLSVLKESASEPEGGRCQLKAIQIQ